MLQHPVSGKRAEQDINANVHESGSYQIEMETGRHILRNRRFIRPRSTSDAEESADSADNADLTPPVNAPTPLRLSPRLAAKKNGMFNL